MRPLSHAQLYPASHWQTVADDAEKRSAERVKRFHDDPVGYLRRQGAIGAKGNVPLGADPAIAAKALAEVAAMSAVVRPSYRAAPLTAPVEPEMHEAPGYSQHKMVDAITDAILELRGERARRRSNDDERNAIKSAFNRTFADVGLRLVNIPNWVRYERTIMEPRLR